MEEIDIRIIIKKLKHELTPSEEVEFNRWFNESEDHQKYFHNFKENYNKAPKAIDQSEAWLKVSKKIQFYNTSGFNIKKWAIAASILMLVGLSFFMNKSKQSTKDKIIEITDNSSKEQIEVGTDKAILKLASGEEVVLEKGRQYENDDLKSNGEELKYGVSSEKSGEDKLSIVSYNILTVPRGGQFHIVLSDGTEVYLNSDSKFKYPVTFLENQPRQVELLYGEAYFEVSPSREHNGAHFMVNYHQQEIDVIGTEFNVKAYSDESLVYTTLVEGLVNINNQDKKAELIPGQQFILNLETNSHYISEVDVKNEISWRKGIFSFKNKSLPEIMRVLSRWYDFEMIYNEEVDLSITFNGSFSKKQRLEDILSAIESTNEAKFNIKGKKIYVK